MQFVEVIYTFLYSRSATRRRAKSFPYFYRMIISSVADFRTIPKRIISLVPSQTELLHFLWLEEETIGITKFCIYPPEWFGTKTRIGGTKTINIEKINSLDADLIIANKEENVREQVELLAENFPVWVTEVSNLNTSLKMISDIGELTGKQAEADNLKLKINIEFDYLEEAVWKFVERPLRAAYLIWKDPYLTVGGDTFINDMMKSAGFQNIYDTLDRYPEVNFTSLKQQNCEVLLLSSEPFPFSKKHVADLQRQLPGVKIILVNGAMFSWYGSRLLEAPAYFISIIEKVFTAKE